MFHEFNAAQPGSYQIHGSEKPDCRVIFLHGNSQSALRLEKASAQLASYLPKVQIITPNGTYDRGDEAVEKSYRMDYTGKHFTWYPSTEEHVEKNWEDGFFVRHLPEIEKENPNIPIILFGFSQGSWMAADVYLQYPDRFSGLIMQGGTLSDHHIKKIKDDFSNSSVQAQSNIFMLQGLCDPFLYLSRSWNENKKRWRYERGGFLKHYQQSIKDLEQEGITIKTKMVPILAHNFTRQSLKTVADHIQNTMDHDLA